MQKGYFNDSLEYTQRKFLKFLILPIQAEFPPRGVHDFLSLLLLNIQSLENHRILS